MHKFIKIITIFILTCPSFRATSLNKISFANDFDSVYIPPYEQYKVEIEYTLSFVATSVSNTLKIVIIDYFDKEIEIYSKNITSQIDKGALSLNYPENSQVYHTMNLKMSVISNRNGVTICELNPQIPYKNDTVVNPYKLENKTYISNNLLYKYTHTGGETYLEEKYTFSNFSREYETSIYNCIDISKFYISYTPPIEKLIPLSISEGTFLIRRTMNGVKGVFDDFGRSVISDYYCALDLELYNASGVYKIRFKDQMYVDPLTLKMSSTQHSGYIKTNKIYFPREYFDKLDGWEFTFSLKDVGLSEITVGQACLFYNTSYLIGDCANSTYCVGTSSATPDFDYGENIEHD